MNDLAREIVAELEPAEGWQCENTEELLVDVAVAMLEVMNADAVQVNLEQTIEAIRAEYGD